VLGEFKGLCELDRTQTLRPCSIGINRFWLVWLVEFFRVLLGENRFRLVWLINFFNQPRAWLKRLKKWVASADLLASISIKHRGGTSKQKATMTLFLNDDFQDLDMREVSHLIQVQTCC